MAPHTAGEGVSSFVDGRYVHMDDLKQLASMLPHPRETPPPPEVRRVVTSLKASAWERLLQDLPDRECAEFVGRGLKEGFRIGFDRRKVECRSAKHNMLSAESNPAVVNEYLAKEIGHGRVVQVDPATMAIHINRFGVIPKGHQTGKWRLIVDLSHPAGHSVNDGVDLVSCSLSYATVEMAAQRVIAMGREPCWLN